MKKQLTSIRFRIIAVALMSIIFSFCSEGNADHETDSTPGTPVTAINPVRMNMTENLKLNANSLFLNKETIRATFSGFIQTVHKKIGDAINPGDTIFTMQTKEAGANRNLKLNMENTDFSGRVQIKASTKGILSEINFFTGDFVSEGEQLAVVANPSSVAFNLNVPYQFVSKIKTGLICRLIMPDSSTIEAKTEKIIPVIDPESQTEIMILSPLGNTKMPANMNLIAEIPIREVKDALAVSVSAVMTNETQDRFWVMKLVNDSTAVRINIKKGIENRGMIEIKEPAFTTSDKIITDGAFGLPDTAKVFLGK